MDALPPNISLLVAALDLSLVQSVVSAMRGADVASGRAQSVSGLGPAPTPPPNRLERDPVFETRRVFHPTPTYALRQVFHPAPRVEFQPTIRVESELKVEPSPDSAKPEMECPLAPPWRLPIWQTPVPVVPKVKVVLIRPDIINKGSLIDFFI